MQSVVEQITHLSNVITGINGQVLQATPEVQAKINEIPQLPPAPKPQIEVADEKDRTALCDSIMKFASDQQSNQSLYSRLALIAIASAAGLALVGSVASFLSASKTAGVISLVVAAVIGFSNAYPIGPLADYYRSVAAQAHGLSAECAYIKPYTTTLYTSDVNQLKLLYLYEANRPSLGNYGVKTEELVKQLQDVRTASTNVTLAQK